MAKEKTCIRCNTLKPETDYARSHGRPLNYCKDCGNLAARVYRKKKAGGLRFCRHCQHKKPLSAYELLPSGRYRSHCNPCRAEKETQARHNRRRRENLARAERRKLKKYPGPKADDCAVYNDPLKRAAHCMPWR